MDDAQVLYELKNYQQKLNFEIDKLKLQLVLAEQKKLMWVLGKYFLYQEHLRRQLLQQAGEADESLTLESARAELKAMPFYEEIRPTNPFKSNEVKNAGILSAIIIIILFTGFFIFTFKL